MRLRLLVFDWDGTLMDSEARIVDCVHKAITEVGAEARDTDRIRNIIGLGLREAVLDLYPDADPAFLEAVTAAYRRHFLEQGGTPSTLFRGTRGVLDGLAAQGYLLAVATGKGRQGLDSVLAATGLEGRFHATRCADETRSKPHPQMLMELMAELNVSGDRTLMIGDTVYDLEMAGNAATQGLAVSYGVHGLDRLLDQGPVGHIDDITELPAWLGQYARKVSYETVV